MNDNNDNNDNRDRRLSCTEALARIHAVLDGDLMDVAERQALDDHLEGCTECRAARVEFEQIQSSLRGLTSVPFPDDAFQQVLAETSRAPKPAVHSRWGVGWRAAAAAVLAVGMTATLWGVWSTTPTGPDQAEIDQAAAEARMVLKLTAQAFARTQHAAIEGVMSGEVSPALNRVPMNMPAVPDG
jgi:anti-sigma factor RsiW